MIASIPKDIFIRTQDGLDLSEQETAVWKKHLLELFELFSRENGFVFLSTIFYPFDPYGNTIRFLLIDGSHELLGMATLIREQQVGNITSFYIRPGYRGLQIGEHLQHRIAAVAEQKQIRRIDRRQLLR